MKTKIFLCSFVASMFFLASCTKDEEEKLQNDPDILGTWVNVHHFSNGEFIYADKNECDYIVILGELFEYHEYDVSQSDYITFKDGVLDISLTEDWENEKFEYHTKGNNISVNGFWDGTYEFSPNRLILNFDDKIEVYEKVKEMSLYDKNGRVDYLSFTSSAILPPSINTAKTFTSLWLIRSGFSMLICQSGVYT